jgi:hypothetical protein
MHSVQFSRIRQIQQLLLIPSEIKENQAQFQTQVATVENRVEPWELDRLAAQIGREVARKQNERDRDAVLGDFAFGRENEDISAVDASVASAVEEEVEDEEVEEEVDAVVEEVHGAADAGLAGDAERAEDGEEDGDDDEEVDDGQSHHEAEVDGDCFGDHLG